ncbi:MAG: chemotaxis protein CheW [Kofleriaceae bacterium]
MNRARQLREAFDRGFAAAPATAPELRHELLRIEVGGAPYAIVLADLASLHVDLEIVPVPARSPALLGVIALRGAIVPVFDLSVMLGVAARRPPRWLAIAGANAFAFDHVAGHCSVAELPAGRVIQHDGRAHPLVDFGLALQGVMHA